MHDPDTNPLNRFVFKTGNSHFKLDLRLILLQVEYLADLRLIFKLHFSYLLNRCLRAVYMLEGGVILMY